MTTKRLEELTSLNYLKNELFDIIKDCEKDYWIEIRTPHHEVRVKGDNFRKSLIKLMRDTYEYCCKTIEDA